ENAVEKIKTIVKDNQTNLMIAGAVAGTAALGYYGVKKAMHHVHSNESKELFDSHFQDQNLPLLATEASFRDRLLSNVTYELVMNLQSKESSRYSGRLKASFMLSDKTTPEDLAK